MNGTSRLNEDTLKCEYLGVLNERGFMDEASAFIQDSWRMKPTITMNYGVAYVVQLPLSAGNGVYSTTDYAGFCGPCGIAANGQCKLFQVGGDQTGVTPQFVNTRRTRRATTPTTTTLRRTSVFRGGPIDRTASCGRSSAIPIRRRSAPAYRSASTSRGSTSSPASTATTRAGRSTRTATTAAAASSCS